MQAAWTAVNVAGFDAPCRDYSMSLSPASGRVTAGRGISTTVTITPAPLNGFNQPVLLSVTGLAPGMTAAFSPATATILAPSVLTVSTATGTPAGTTTIHVNGIASTNGYVVARSVDYQLTVTPPVVVTGCTVTNNTDVGIPDHGAAVLSSVSISGCDEVTAPTTATVTVHAVHPHCGDLVIDLVGPDGTAYPLKASSPADASADVDQTFSVALGGAGSMARANVQVQGPTWSLRVQDVITGNVGFLDSWTVAI